MLQDIGKRALGAFAATVGVLMVSGLLLGFVEGRSTLFLTRAFGWAGIVITGLVGTPIHELGHLLTAKLFGFHITDVALFRPFAGRADGVLGYVSYTYEKGNLWQQLGCFFVGIAPMVMGVLAILLLLRLLVPGPFRAAKERLDRGGDPWSRLTGVFCGFWLAFFHLRGWALGRGVIALYLVFSVSTHMTLSPADLKGAAVGLVMVAVLCLLFGLVTALLKSNVTPMLQKTAAVLGAFFGVGIAFATLALLLFALVALLFG